MRDHAVPNGWRTAAISVTGRRLSDHSSGSGTSRSTSRNGVADVGGRISPQRRYLNAPVSFSTGFSALYGDGRASAPACRSAHAQGFRVSCSSTERRKPTASRRTFLRSHAAPTSRRRCRPAAPRTTVLRVGVRARLRRQPSHLNGDAGNLRLAFDMAHLESRFSGFDAVAFYGRPVLNHRARSTIAQSGGEVPGRLGAAALGERTRARRWSTSSSCRASAIAAVYEQGALTPPTVARGGVPAPSLEARCDRGAQYELVLAPRRSRNGFRGRCARLARRLSRTPLLVHGAIALARQEEDVEPPARRVRSRAPAAPTAQELLRRLPRSSNAPCCSALVVRRRPRRRIRRSDFRGAPVESQPKGCLHHALR